MWEAVGRNLGSDRRAAGEDAAETIGVAVISPRLSSVKGDLGPEYHRRELLAFDPPCAGRGEVVVEEREREGDVTKEEETKP